MGTIDQKAQEREMERSRALFQLNEGQPEEENPISAAIGGAITGADLGLKFYKALNRPGSAGNGDNSTVSTGTGRPELCLIPPYGGSRAVSRA